MGQVVLEERNLIASFFTGIGDEPISRHLAPISDYHDVPLLTIEESVILIKNICSDIQENVIVAKRGMANPRDGLSNDESVSIHLFTMPSYTGVPFHQALNKALRTEDRRILKPRFPYLKIFLAALDKLPSRRMIVFCPMRNVDLRSEYSIGRELTWWGVTSCSSSMEKLEPDHLLGKNGLRTLFCIDCQNCKSIATHSYSGSAEDEFLLMPEFHFEVLQQMTPVNDLHIIHLKEITSS